MRPEGESTLTDPAHSPYVPHIQLPAQRATCTHKYTCTRACCSRLLHCRRSFCLLCFFTGGEWPRGGGRGTKNTTPIHCKQQSSCTAAEGDFTASSCIMSLVSCVFNATCSQIQLSHYQNTLKRGERTKTTRKSKKLKKVTQHKYR